MCRVVVACDPLVASEQYSSDGAEGLEKATANLTIGRIYKINEVKVEKTWDFWMVRIEIGYKNT